ncbi:MAG TPA: pyridoxine 5'-phosphate synthase [Planctomycetota bacterium]|nr:pyridoxine 5'-phosphate synthase [Planctomycetota bacterium]
MAKLGVNIDHVATVRQARKTYEPDPVWAAAEAELGGADQITVHLREDRRHIQERDVEILLKTVQTRVNLELAVASDVLKFALRTKPHCACLVPERREEVTTEGGLDVAGSFKKVKDAVKQLSDAGILVSLFIDADRKQIDAASKSGAPFIEIHTGTYANARSELEIERTFKQIQAGAKQARDLGLRVNAGHGLNYRNVIPIAQIPGMEELNIGHAIIARSIFTGLRQAVREMKELID